MENISNNSKNDEFFNNNNLDIKSSLFFLKKNKEKIIKIKEKKEKINIKEIFKDNSLDIKSSLLYI